MDLLQVIDRSLLQEIGDEFFSSDVTWKQMRSRHSCEEMRTWIVDAMEQYHVSYAQVRMIVGDYLSDTYRHKAIQESFIEHDESVSYSIQTDLTLPNGETAILDVHHHYNGHDYYVENTANEIYPENDKKVANFYFQGRKTIPPVQEKLAVVHNIIKDTDWTISYQSYQTLQDGYYEVRLLVNGVLFSITTHHTHLLNVKMVGALTVSLMEDSHFKQELFAFIQTKSPLRMEFLYD